MSMSTIDPHDDEAFRKVIRGAVEQEKHTGQKAGRFLRKLCSRFGVSRATAKRWVDGVSVPHPVVRPRLYRFIAQYVRAAEIEHRG